MAATIKYLQDLDIFIFGYILPDTDKVIKELEKILANGN